MIRPANENLEYFSKIPSGWCVPRIFELLQEAQDYNNSKADQNSTIQLKSDVKEGRLLSPLTPQETLYKSKYYSKFFNQNLFMMRIGVVELFEYVNQYGWKQLYVSQKRLIDLWQIPCDNAIIILGNRKFENFLKFVKMIKFY